MTAQLLSAGGVAVGNPIGGLVLAGEFDTELVGFAANIPVTFRYWQLVGGLVILQVKVGAQAVSTNTTLSVPAGGVPVELRPKGSSAQGLCTVQDNGVTRFGLCTVFGLGLGALGGQINFALASLVTGAIAGTNFTAAGTKGLPTSAQIIYPLAAPG